MQLSDSCTRGERRFVSLKSRQALTPESRVLLLSLRTKVEDVYVSCSIGKQNLRKLAGLINRNVGTVVIEERWGGYHPRDLFRIMDESGYRGAVRAGESLITLLKDL